MIGAKHVCSGSPASARGFYKVAMEYLRHDATIAGLNSYDGQVPKVGYDNALGEFDRYISETGKRYQSALDECHRIYIQPCCNE